MMAEVARHTNPGGTFATYTAAGAVRRALAEAGSCAARAGFRPQTAHEHRAPAMTEQDTTKGIWLMVAVALIFALQDAFSRHLAGEYNVLMIVMIRYWFFAGLCDRGGRAQGRGAATGGGHETTPSSKPCAG